MEKFELYLENENGQIEINWDSLALVTSVEYVEKVKEIMSIYGKTIIDFDVYKSEFAEIILTDETNRLFYTVKYTNFNYCSKPQIRFDIINKSSIDRIIDFLEGEK